MSLEQKIPDGVIVIPRTHPLSWIMMFYALPKEMFENLPEYRQLPRNMRDIQVSEKYMRMINCDDFLIMIWSLYAWMVWHCLRVPGKNGEYRPISGAWGHYSEDFPIWRMTYEIGMHFREVFEHYSNWKVQRLFDLKKDEEMPWLSLPDFCTIVKSMTQFVIDNMNLQPLIDEVWYHRAEEDYAGENYAYRDFMRSWTHSRTASSVSIDEIIESGAWRDFKGELPLLFGKDAAGKELVADLAKMPHMLVAGATGQGKSVCLNSIINGLLMTKTPDQLKFIMVDPKSVEFTPYASIPHLLVPVITDNNKASGVLALAVAEMEKRLKMFARARVRNIYDFNHRPQLTQTNMFGDDTPVGGEMQRTLPYIVIIIDEVADLMAAAAKVVTPNIARLTAKARAAGIHVILATQRPDAKVITGTVKANIPGRVAFKTATGIDSRTILDEGGAENLIGKGDMLFRTAEGMLVRAQGAWISDEEITRITQFIEQHSNVEFDETFNKKLSKIKEASIDDDENGEDEDSDVQDRSAEKERVKAEANASDFKKAVECIINTNRASTSHFQRRLGWGYNHAAKILDLLEQKGIVSGQQGAGPRQILMDQQQLVDIFNGGESGGGEYADDDGDSVDLNQSMEEMQ